MAKRQKTSKPADQDEHQDQDVYPPMATPEGMTLMPVEALKYNVPPAFDMSEHPAELAELKAGNKGPMTNLMVQFVREHLPESGCIGCAAQARCRTFREAFPDQTEFDPAQSAESRFMALLQELYGTQEPSEAERQAMEDLNQRIEHALTDDHTTPDKQVVENIQDLDDLIDLGEKHECIDPTCRVNEFILMRVAQRERIGYKPIFHIARIELVESPDQKIPDGYTRFKCGELPIWLQAYIANQGVDPDGYMSLLGFDVAIVGKPPEDDDPVNFVAFHMRPVNDLGMSLTPGHTRFTRDDGYPIWLQIAVAKRGADAYDFIALDAKWVGTPPMDDSPASFYIVDVNSWENGSHLPATTGYIRFSRDEGFPSWLVKHMESKYGPLPLFIDVLDVKYLGTPPAESVETGELADWLKALDETAQGDSSATSTSPVLDAAEDDLPAWLKDLNETE